ncbi:Peroxidase 16 [Bienertia sinuspersici]
MTNPSVNMNYLNRVRAVLEEFSCEKDIPEDVDYSLDQLKAMFAKHNLNQVDLITHFAKRLFNPVDSTLNPAYDEQIMQVFLPNMDLNTIIPMIPYSLRTFDNMHYRNLIPEKGLFTSDEVLFTGPKSLPIIEEFAT